MSIQITIELPEGALSALRKNPADYVKEMQIAAAVKWLEMGIISQAKAAEIAGLSREEFLRDLARFNVSPFQSTPEDLAEELKDA
jgi:predicted HTH domain antitoxin